MQTTYCMSFRNNTGNKNAKVLKTKNGRLQLKSISSECGNKRFRFVSKNQGSSILSSLGIKTPLSKIAGVNIMF